VDYTQPGWFEWAPQGHRWLRWAVRSAPGPEGKWLPVPVVRGRTREAALQALRQVDPQIRDAIRAVVQGQIERGALPSTTVFPLDGQQIVPTRLELTTIYIPGTTKDPLSFWQKGHQEFSDLD
jgi:hypothetical protein